MAAPQMTSQTLAQLLGGGGGGGFGAQLPGAGGSSGPAGAVGPPPGPGAPAPGDPNTPQPPGAMPGAMNPQDAAVWAAFPSTDPNVVGQMVQSAQAQGVQGIMQLLPQFEQMAQQDEDALYQKQQATLHAIIDGLIGPNPAAQAAPGAGTPPPGVGGDTTGY